MRYHQSSTVSGRIWIDGKQIEVTDEQWFGFRDHCWGRAGQRHRLPPRHRPVLRLQGQPAWRLARPAHLDGERYADVSEPKTAREVHQLRDCVVRCREGDATGYGLTRDTSFL